MDKQTSTNQRHSAAMLATRALQHFQTLAMLNALDAADRDATAEQFAAAARVTARAISIARAGSR